MDEYHSNLSGNETKKIYVSTAQNLVNEIRNTGGLLESGLFEIMPKMGFLTESIGRVKAGSRAKCAGGRNCVSPGYRAGGAGGLRWDKMAQEMGRREKHFHFKFYFQFQASIRGALINDQKKCLIHHRGNVNTK
jgi:hypothetical protein